MRVKGKNAVHERALIGIMRVFLTERPMAEAERGVLSGSGAKRKEQADRQSECDGGNGKNSIFLHGLRPPFPAWTV